MKKIMVLFFSVCLCVSFTGCFYTVKTDEPTKETGANQSSLQKTDDSKEEVFGLNETAAFKSLKITATEIKKSSGDEFFKPEEGKEFVGIKFTVENISNEEEHVSSLLLFDSYADDVKLEYSLTANTVFKEGTIDGSVKPGKKLIGWYALEVPKNWKDLEINVKSNWLSSKSAKFAFKQK